MALRRTLLAGLRLRSGLASRARNLFYKALGVEIAGYAWLRRIEIPRHHSAIALGHNVALDTDVVLLVSLDGEHRPGKRIRIGDNTYINRHTFIDASLDVSIGRDVAIGPFCYITDHDHGTAPGMPVTQQPLRSSPTVIGDGAWLGANVTVLKGVRIGDNAVIAAGSTVTRDIPPNTIARGQPAVAVRER